MINMQNIDMADIPTTMPRYDPPLPLEDERYWLDADGVPSRPPYPPPHRGAELIRTMLDY